MFNQENFTPDRKKFTQAPPVVPVTNMRYDPMMFIQQANLLGGRAWRYTMTPLCYPEIDNLDLEKAMVCGLLPPHLLSPDPIQDLRSYVADYLKEEIIAEAAVQNILAFSEFLKMAALTSGELLNYTNVARETGVSAKVIRNYFQILESRYL